MAIEIFKLKQTCPACPAQWEFITFQNRPVYVRYRWGYLSVSIGSPNGDISSAVRGYEIICEKLGDNFDGSLDWDVVDEKLYQIDQKALMESLNELDIGS